MAVFKGTLCFGPLIYSIYTVYSDFSCTVLYSFSLHNNSEPLLDTFEIEIPSESRKQIEKSNKYRFAMSLYILFSHKTSMLFRFSDSLMTHFRDCRTGYSTLK